MANVTPRVAYSQPYTQTNPRMGSFMNRLPWGHQIFEDLTNLNSVYSKLANLIPSMDELVRDMSVFETDTEYMYSNYDSDKLRRLGEYRTMAAYSTVADCLDEIADEILFEDSGLFCKLEFNGIGDKEIKNELNREFESFCNIAAGIRRKDTRG